ncbi:MAG: hypothetical protein WD200_04725 [Candidatus Andersenbacteria bacterium]
MSNLTAEQLVETNSFLVYAPERLILFRCRPRPEEGLSPRIDAFEDCDEDKVSALTLELLNPEKEQIVYWREQETENGLRLYTYDESHTVLAEKALSKIREYLQK